jgi:hypothetical protein
MEKHGDSELSAAHPNETGRGADDDAEKKAKRTAPSNRRIGAVAALDLCSMSSLIGSLRNRTEPTTAPENAAPNPGARRPLNSCPRRSPRPHCGCPGPATSPR